MKKLFTLLLSITLTTTNAQDSKQSEFIEIKDLEYYSGKDASPYHKLNLVVPKNKPGSALMLWIGGGAWSYVDRNMEMDFARKLAREGIAVASVGHRLSPAVWKDSSMTTGIKHPEHIKDIALAFRWLLDNAAKYGYSKSNIYVGGFSSGAHLVTLLAMDDRYLKKVGCSRDQISGIIAFGGTYDIPHYYKVLAGSDKALAEDHVKGVFGKTREEFLDASPTSYMNGLRAPLLLISDKNPYKYGKFFEGKIRESGIQNTEVFHVELGHGALWKNISYEENSKYRNEVVEFIKRLATQN